MFRPKTLIHLLVSLALILNGVGAAAASAVMATMPADAVASVASEGEAPVDSKQAAIQSGCHEHESSSSVAMTPPPSHANADVTDAGITAGEGDSIDCCKDGACGCGCAHQSQVVLGAEFLMMPAIAPESIPRAHLAALLSPSLSRPVRPPIA